MARPKSSQGVYVPHALRRLRDVPPKAATQIPPAPLIVLIGTLGTSDSAGHLFPRTLALWTIVTKR